MGVDYTGCSGCENHHKNISTDSLNYQYCIKKCPTGFGTTASDTYNCVLQAAAGLVMSYNFNIPSQAFNNGTGLDQSLNLVKDTNVVSTTGSGYPAKNRGLSFDGSGDAYVVFPKFIIHHTFSIHFWALPKTTAAAGKLNTILSKDRAYNKLLLIGLDENDKIYIEIPKYSDPTATPAPLTSTGTIGTAAWKYGVVSVDMPDGKKSIVTFFINNASDSVQNFNERMLVDEEDFMGYMGA